MIDYPINYKKPNLIEFIVDYIMMGGHVDEWDREDLGEWLAIEFDSGAKNLKLTDDEYMSLCNSLDRWIKKNWGEAIQDEINKRMEEAQEDVKERLALMSDLYN